MNQDKMKPTAKIINDLISDIERHINDFPEYINELQKVQNNAIDSLYLIQHCIDE